MELGASRSSYHPLGDHHARRLDGGVVDVPLATDTGYRSAAGRGRRCSGRRPAVPPAGRSLLSPDRPPPAGARSRPRDGVGRVARHVAVAGHHHRDRIAGKADGVDRHRAVLGRREWRPDRHRCRDLAMCAKTDSTPSIASAALVSMDRIRPCATSLRLKVRCCMPAISTSSPSVPRPWIRRGSSRRLTRWPTSFGRTDATIKVHLQFASFASFASRLFIVAYGNLSSGWRAQAIVSVAQEQGAGSATSSPVVGAWNPPPLSTSIANSPRPRPTTRQRRSGLHAACDAAA